MQEGIGRGGYRVLALVFVAVGALGLLIADIAVKPSGAFAWLGFALAAIALAALAILTMATLGPGSARAPAPEPEPLSAPGAPVPLETPEPPMEADPSADVGFEYSDVPAPLGQEPDRFLPPPRPQPPPVPITQPRRAPRTDAGTGTWPERTPPSGMTRRQAMEQAIPGAPPPGPSFESDAPKPARREAPIIMARTVASAEATGIPEGTGVGKCGNCGVLLLAPKKRPIRLQCPRCERVHTLA